MKTLIIQPVGPLRGTVHLPGDKSITHRAFILGALGEGETTVSGYCRGEDCLNTLRAIQALGIQVNEESAQVMITGKGLWGMTEPSEPLDCGNSGTGMRLLSGVLSGQDFFSIITGDASLRSRPMGRIVRPLRMMGATIAGRKAGEYAPLAITGGNLHGCDYESPVASAQVKSSVLFAGLLAEGTTRFTEPIQSRDHTERLLRYLGIPLQVEKPMVAINGRVSFEGRPLVVPGDLSAAAFFLVAASIVPESEVYLPNVGINPARAGILEILADMGADIEVQNRREASGEPVADLVARSSSLHGIHIGESRIPKTIDELPILCVAAAAAKGETQITGAQELRVKETDRIHAMAQELGKLHVSIQETPDGLRIKGGTTFHGAACHSLGDHRVAMSLAVAGLLADSPTMIDDPDCIETSFPDFEGKLLELLTNSP